MQISVGCNCVCSYCIVPQTRGREVSRDPARAGGRGRARSPPTASREVTLLGQNVNCYGRDLPKETRIDLRRAAGARRRGRGHRAHPLHEPAPEGHARGRDPRPRRAAARSASTSTCRSSRGRAASSRRCAAPTTASATWTASRMIREHVPDCALTTDIIVGFPGETEADFEETLEVVEEVGYDGAFTFIFSPRRGPRRPTLPRPASASRSSASAWSAWSRRCSGARPSAAQRFVGRTMEVLVEGPSAHRPLAAARPHAAQQDRQLRRHRRPGRDRRGRDHERHVHDARRPREAPEQSPARLRTAGLRGRTVL